MKLTVIGAGPGGYETALYAAKRGLDVTIVEKDALGGTCLNRGCIPTKALLAVSDTVKTIRDAASYGITVPEGVMADFEAAFARKDSVVKALNSGVEYLLSAAKVRVLRGTGTIADAHHVKVALSDGGSETVETDKIIIATGSEPSVPASFGYDGERIITSNEILALNTRPASLIIIGGGVIGCELAQFFARMGTQVTILEMMPHILPNEDRDTVRALEKSFRKDGIKVFCGKGVEKLEPVDGGVTVTLSDGNAYTAEKVLVSTGRRPATRNIGLENIGVETDRRGFIPVDGYMHTCAEDVYAIGDVVPTQQLAHVAAYEGFVAVDHICGDLREADYRAVPGCVYTNPEVATVGLTETAAEAKGIPVKVGRYDFMGLGKAKASGHTEGFVKVLADQNDVIVGGTVVGAHATELLQTITLAVQFQLTAEQVGHTIFPHPTMGEAIMEAVHDIHHLSVHKP